MRTQQTREFIIQEINNNLNLCAKEQKNDILNAHLNSPWKSLENCPNDFLDSTYEYVKRLISHE